MRDKDVENIKLGSLFDGIGGFPLAATLHGIAPVWASEIEKFPIEVTKIRFPNMKHLGDITQINGAEIEPVDIITFGSPCQDLSVAGKRDGLEGKRSNLFYQAVRIIREMRDVTNGKYPTFAIWENVPGAFSSNKRQDFRAVLEEILEAEIPMPYSGKWATAGMVRGDGRSVAWRVLDAQYWGVPQRRKRIFLVADFTGQRAPEILFEREGVSGHIAESEEKGQGTSEGARDSITTAGGKRVTATITATYGTKWNGNSGADTGDHFILDKKAREEVASGIGDGVENASYGLDSYNQTVSEEIINPIRSASGGDTKPMALVSNAASAKSYGLVSKGNGEAWITPERHMALNTGGGQAGQGYPAALVPGTGVENAIPVLDMANPNSECNINIAPTLCSRMGTGGNQVPVTVTYGIQGSMIGRADKNGPQGDGIAEDKAHTLDQAQGQAVAFQPGNLIRQAGAPPNEKTFPTLGATTLGDQFPHVASRILFEPRSQDGVPRIHESEIVPTLNTAQGGQRQPCIASFTPSQFAQYQEGVGTLRANGGDLGGGSKNLVQQNYTVRRLTPTECERLQGFPDNWTSIPGASDTGRYKALGNSVAVPCVSWIIGRIKEAIE